MLGSIIGVMLYSGLYRLTPITTARFRQINHPVFNVINPPGLVFLDATHWYRKTKNGAGGVLTVLFEKLGAKMMNSRRVEATF